jgi:drug/metabolite transporter (DMT)-like permease
MALGFIGIIFVLKPTSALFTPASAIGLFSGLCAAAGILGIRELSKSEHTYTIMFYYTSVALIISSVLVIFYWQKPDCYTLLLLLGVGVFGMLYQELLTRALAYAPAYIPSSLMYLSVVFSGIFGMLIWGHIPDAWSWLGIVLVCLGNIFVIVLR